MVEKLLALTYATAKRQIAAILLENILVVVQLVLDGVKECNCRMSKNLQTNGLDLDFEADLPEVGRSICEFQAQPTRPKWRAGADCEWVHHGGVEKAREVL